MKLKTVELTRRYGQKVAVDHMTSIRLLGIAPKVCYTLARIGSRSRRTSKVHSAYNFINSRKGKL